MQNRTEYYCWACDFKNNTGEGNLARLFLTINYNQCNYKVFTPNYLQIFNYKYLSPFLGIILCWFFFLMGKKVIYLNYLPLWNFLIFLMLPPRTILGPITGGANFSKFSKDYLIRKFIFPTFYKISEAIIYLRHNKIYFSTDLLKKNLSYLLKKKIKFNFIKKTLKLKKSPNIKIFDFCLYYRKHQNKIANYPYSFIRKLIYQGYKVNVIGDRLNISGVKNHGFLSKQKVTQILKKTKFTISSNENLYTFFILDCINNSVKILLNRKVSTKNKSDCKNFISHDFTKVFYE